MQLPAPRPARQSRWGLLSIAATVRRAGLGRCFLLAYPVPPQFNRVD